MKKTLFLLLCVLILAATTICCVAEFPAPDFTVTIGVPQSGGVIDFSKSKALTAPEDIDTVISTPDNLFRVIHGSAADTLRTIVNDQLANYK